MKIAIAKLFATFFYAGYTPIAPGTAGAILASVIIYSITLLNVQGSILLCILIALVICSFIIGVISTKVVQSIWGNDPSKVVIDEACGLWISLLLVPLTWQNILIGLILFRLFDIFKPFGIKKLDNWHNAYGVMLDDVLAGIYASVCTYVAYTFVPSIF